jgi:hypothetical protein
MIKEILIVAAIFGVGAAVGRYTLPERVVEKEKIVYKEVTKENTKDATEKNVKKNKVTVRVVTIKPDGTKTIETKIIDQGETVTVSNSETVKETKVEVVKEKESETVYVKNDYLLSVSAQNFLSDRSYGVLAQRRLLGPIYMGASVHTDRTYSVNVGLAF